MAQDSNQIDVSLEVGKKKTFATAMDWPGWCRSGRDLVKIVGHVLDVDAGYLSILGGKFKPGDDEAPQEALAQVRGRSWIRWPGG